MDPDTRPGSGHQASGLEPWVPLKRLGIGLDWIIKKKMQFFGSQKLAVHIPIHGGTSLDVGAVCSTASLRRRREMQAQSSHDVGDGAISFLGIAAYSMHHWLASLPFDQSIGLRRLGRSPNATSVPSRKPLSCLVKETPTASLLFHHINTEEPRDG
ncbi:hypothetical protein J3F84DRAFT_242393 [Trichoderma pleuroticola]